MWGGFKVGLSLAASAAAPRVLIMQVLQPMGGKRKRKKKKKEEREGFSFPRSNGSKDQDAEGRQKADWLHVLSVFVLGWTPSFPPSREMIFL